MGTQNSFKRFLKNFKIKNHILRQVCHVTKSFLKSNLRQPSIETNALNKSNYRFHSARAHPFPLISTVSTTVTVTDIDMLYNWMCKGVLCVQEVLFILATCNIKMDNGLLEVKVSV